MYLYLCNSLLNIAPSGTSNVIQTCPWGEIYVVLAAASVGHEPWPLVTTLGGGTYLFQFISLQTTRTLHPLVDINDLLI